MLSSNNENDRKQMSEYGRANDMLLLKEFFPELCPFDELLIIDNKDEYFNNENRLKEMMTRPDTPIGTEVINKIWKGGDHQSQEVTAFFQEHPDAKIIFFKLNHPTNERYERQGMSIGVNLGGAFISNWSGKASMVLTSQGEARYMKVSVSIGKTSQC